MDKLNVGEGMELDVKGMGNERLEGVVVWIEEMVEKGKGWMKVYGGVGDGEKDFGGGMYVWGGKWGKNE